MVPCVFLKPCSISRLSIGSDSFNLQLSLMTFLQLCIQFFYVGNTMCLSEQARFLNHKALYILCIRSRVLNLGLEKIYHQLDDQRVKMEIRLTVCLRTYVSCTLSASYHSHLIFAFKTWICFDSEENRKKMDILPG